MSKWDKHRGYITVKIGEDDFNLKFTNNIWYKFVTSIEGNRITEKSIEKITEAITDALSLANPDIDRSIIREVVENNFIVFMSAISKKIGGVDDSTKNLVMDRIKRFEDGQNS